MSYLQSGAEVFVFPASPEQTRYWLLNRLAEYSTANNMVVSVRVDGQIDDQLVERAIRALLQRHESLRTTLDLVDGELCQLISEEPNFSFEVLTLAEGTETARTEKALALIRRHGATVLDLGHGPVVLVQLLHLTADLHYLTFNLHYSVCDGWSNGVLLSDFAELYTALAEQRDSNLPPLAFQFADFTMWQQEWLQTPQAAEATEFWHQQAQLDFSVLDMPMDRMRSAGSSAPGAIETKKIENVLEAALKAYARARGVTLHIVLQTACEVLLSRISGQERYLLGSTIANRTRSGMDNLIGRYANPQIILADVSGDPTFRELLDRVSAWNARAYSYQDLPFSKVVEEFQQEKQTENSQFLSAFFVYQRAFMQQQRTPAITLTPIPSASAGVSYDLLLTPVEDEDGLQIEVEYNTTLFTKRRICSLIDQYVAVLETVIAGDGIRVSTIELRTAVSTEPVALVSAASKTTIVALLDAQSTLRKNAVVLIDGDRPYTWAELDRRAAQFSGALQNHGLSAGNSVAISLLPSLNTIALCLACLRNALVILPVSSHVSVDQWVRLIQDINPAASFTSRDFSRQLAGALVPEDLLAFAASSDLVPVEHSVDAVAWAGLTILPNGHIATVPVTHAFAAQQLLAATHPLGLRAGDSVATFMVPGSVDAFTDILLPLISGCKLVLVGDTPAREIQALFDREQVYAAIGTDEQCMALFAAGWTGDRRVHLICHSLHTAEEHLNALTSRVHHVTAFYTAAEVGGPFAASPIEDIAYLTPVFPLQGQRLAVLDAKQMPAPAGVFGTLALHTPLGERISPWTARSRADAGFEIMDLTERTVEHKGARIALRDVEEAIISNSVVDTAAAYMSSGAAGPEPELLLSVILRPNAVANAASLRQYLAERIAPYLMPDRLLITNALPRRVDGTVDPLLVESEQELSDAVSYVGPRDEIETELATIWEQVLSRKNIGVDDNFFTFGGYSLTIVRLFARINKAFKSNLPITTVFNAPTIAQLAEILRGHSVFSALVPVQTTGTKSPLFMLHSYLLYGSLPAALGPDQPFYGLRETGHDGALDIEQRAASYVKEIRTIQPHGPYYLAGWCAAGAITVETAHQLTQSGETVALTLLFDAWHPSYPEELALANKASRSSFRNHPFFEKIRFHRLMMRDLAPLQRTTYLRDALVGRIKKTQHGILVKNWELAHRIAKRTGWKLPDFMQNVSYGTFASVNRYRGVVIPGRITLIRARESDNLANAREDCGWSRMTSMGVDVTWAPGNHESMFREPNLAVTASLVRSHIAQAEVSATHGVTHYSPIGPQLKSQST